MTEISCIGRTVYLADRIGPDGQRYVVACWLCETYAQERYLWAPIGPIQPWEPGRPRPRTWYLPDDPCLDDLRAKFTVRPWQPVRDTSPIYVPTYRWEEYLP